MTRPRLTTLTLAAALAVGIAAAAGPLLAAGADEAMPDGPGKDIIQRGCTSCHGADFIVARKRTADEWDTLVGRMLDKGAAVEAGDKEVLIAYLVKNYGSGTPTPPPPPAAPLPPLPTLPPTGGAGE